MDMESRRADESQKSTNIDPKSNINLRGQVASTEWGLTPQKPCTFLCKTQDIVVYGVYNHYIYVRDIVHSC